MQMPFFLTQGYYIDIVKHAYSIIDYDGYESIKKYVLKEPILRPFSGPLKQPILGPFLRP